MQTKPCHFFGQTILLGLAQAGTIITEPAEVSFQVAPAPVGLQGLFLFLCILCSEPAPDATTGPSSAPYPILHTFRNHMLNDTGPNHTGELHLYNL